MPWCVAQTLRESVQCVQPMPKSIAISEQEVYIHNACMVSSVCMQDEKHSGSSPTMSPAPKQVEKRRRTLREHSYPHTRTQIAGGREIYVDMFTNMHDYVPYQRPSISQFSIRSFHVFPQLSCTAAKFYISVHGS